ncbi:MAG: type III PLP-dependent enzyme [Spirochaetes bacterium]|nr:type III PLP-dependent enzyme [Spirochaetota bacterium]
MGAPQELPEWPHLEKLLATVPTPFLMVNLADIRRRYLELQRVFPGVKIYYSVKANPAVQVLGLLRDLGAYFDIASIYELDRLLGLSVPPARISYGNTIKKEKDIAYAYERGVRYYASDSDEDMRKIARAAPGSRIFFRIITEGSGADWPLSKKFGAHPDVLFTLILEARELGLDPMGLSFHVGSQQRDIGQWDQSIAHCRYLFDACREKGTELSMINLGGGLPSNYLHETLGLDVYAGEILRFVEEDFPKNPPELWIEPGRGMVGDAGILASEVVLISQKNRRDIHKWVYIDAGLFGGLIETLGEAIKYPILTDRTSSLAATETVVRDYPRERADMEVVLAGPTCDSMDILYQNHRYRLPRDLSVGDHVFFLSTGAYTTSYSSVEFNGFPPLKAYFIDGDQPA